MSSMKTLIDDFTVGNFSDFNGHKALTQTGPVANLAGGTRFVNFGGSSDYISGVSQGSLNVGANAGTFSFTLGYGTLFSGSPLKIVGSPSASVVVTSKAQFGSLSVPAVVTIYTDPNRVSVSQVVDVGPKGPHFFPLSTFLGNADLANINTLSVSLLSQTVADGKNLVVSLETIDVE